METSVKFLVESRLPTKFGGFRVLAFDSGLEEMPHLALVSDIFNKDGVDPVSVRIHSECMTGDVLRSSRCDCGDQLTSSMALLQKSGGVLIYLRQEGRGIGLVEKLKAYNLQDAGQDTYEANVNLGHPEDGRTFEPAIEIIRHLGIRKIKVLTNNPEKVRAFDDLDDLEVVERVPLQVGSDPENIEYLEAKKIVKGHFFS
ncbi:MAG: GTP cyclohydrolase II [Flavobacteriales bacterium]|mgnify:FL=1|jgi:GTP cyclohydrolase II|nr:GTP cyclohydrolase II [Flavobacteriales bacterium]MBT7653194.1 GTP cyclohydrolase II [Flavobacteriales bacterium]